MQTNESNLLLVVSAWTDQEQWTISGNKLFTNNAWAQRAEYQKNSDRPFLHNEPRIYINGRNFTDRDGWSLSGVQNTKMQCLASPN